MHRTFAAALTAGALLWSAALLLAPLGLHGRHPVLGTAATFVYEGAGLICHQKSQRSFHPGGVQQPVCARCAGLYFSGAAGVVVAWMGRRRAGQVPRHTRAVLVAAAIPTAVTVALELAGLAHPSNVVRALSALPLGGAAGWVFVRLLRADEDAAAAQGPR